MLEAALQGYGAGSGLQLQIEPEQAVGEFKDQLLFLEPRHLFPDDLREGLTMEGSALPEGCHPDAPRDTLYTITDIYPDHVVLDGNHPLAGIAIRITMKVESVREATEEEIGRGSCGTGFFKLHAGSDDLPPGGLLH